MAYLRTSYPDDELTRDVFLGGALKIWQPQRGYRAATDPILLAASVLASPEQSVLELGCGAGLASLALGVHCPGVELNGVERQPAYAELARRNGAENGIAFDVTQADLNDLPPALLRSFDHVIANPPYYAPSAPAARDIGRAQALREETPLAQWVDVALKRLRPGGYLTMIHLAERLPEILIGLNGRAGDTLVRPIAPRNRRAAGRILLQTRKGARGPFRLLAPLIMHEGDRHLHDGDDFTAQAQAILREGAVLGWD